MIKKTLTSIPWQVKLGLALLASFVLLYYIHYLIFHDLHHIFIYMLGDLAFLPLEVLIVSLIIHNILEAREKNARLHKVNMIIGTFFTEIGSALLYHLAQLDSQKNWLEEQFSDDKQWSQRELVKIEKRFKNHQCNLEYDLALIKEIRTFLILKRPFMLRLLENSNVMEHTTFSALLWAIFHTNEELSRRKNLKTNSPEDKKHILGDLRRGYRILIMEWITYLKHLQKDYPYLFMFEIRANPFTERLEDESYEL